MISISFKPQLKIFTFTHAPPELSLPAITSIRFMTAMKIESQDSNLLKIKRRMTSSSIPVVLSKSKRVLDARKKKWFPLHVDRPELL